MPPEATAPAARVLLFRTDGQVIGSGIPLSAEGDGAKAVSFSSATVARVELVLANASLRTDCWRDNPNWILTYACLGHASDDMLPTDFRARMFRPVT